MLEADNISLLRLPFLHEFGCARYSKESDSIGPSEKKQKYLVNKSLLMGIRTVRTPIVTD